MIPAVCGVTRVLLAPRAVFPQPMGLNHFGGHISDILHRRYLHYDS